MRRRGFLKLLGLLPFVPALAEAAAKTINYTGMDLAVKGSDQTSIWLTSWGKAPGKSMTMLEFAKLTSRDKKLLPMIEVLSQKNPLLQDMVWQERNLQLSHKIAWNTKWHDLSNYVLPTKSMRKS